MKQILQKKKVIFIQLLESTILPYCLLLLCHKMIRQRYSGSVKGMKIEKCIFETPHNEIKCISSIKESNFNEKMDCLWSGLRGLTPPHHGQPDRKMSVCFYAFPYWLKPKGKSEKLFRKQICCKYMASQSVPMFSLANGIQTENSGLVRMSK